MKTKEMQTPGNTDFESFYKIMETEPRKLEEAFEVLLEMVISDPESTKNVALLIKEDYPSLYKSITALTEANKDNGTLPSCCGGH
jgi:hypothetical protein